VVQDQVQVLVLVLVLAQVLEVEWALEVVQALVLVVVQALALAMAQNVFQVQFVKMDLSNIATMIKLLAIPGVKNTTNCPNSALIRITTLFIASRE